MPITKISATRAAVARPGRAIAEPRTGNPDDVEEELEQLDDSVVRWALPRADGRYVEAFVGHVYRDAAGAELVLDSSQSGAWYLYPLREVIQLDDDNQPTAAAPAAKE